MEIWDTLIACVRETAEEEGGITQLPSLARDVEISKLGLDSLGFVTLLSKLEERFGKDPLSTSEVPFPLTLGDLASLYETVPG